MTSGPAPTSASSSLSELRCWLLKYRIKRQRARSALSHVKVTLCSAFPGPSSNTYPPRVLRPTTNPNGVALAPGRRSAVATKGFHPALRVAPSDDRLRVANSDHGRSRRGVPSAHAVGERQGVEQCRSTTLRLQRKNAIHRRHPRPKQNRLE